MTDKQFNTLLIRLAKSKRQYDLLLDSAENEIVRRFGKHPSDVDCDAWIDTYHVGNGLMTASELGNEMEYAIELHQKSKRYDRE